MTHVGIIAVLGLLVFSACEKNRVVRQVDRDIVEGSWKVSLFKEDGVDETSDYSDYVFEFDKSGTVSAVRTGSTVSGTWETQKDDDHVDFSLNMAMPLEDLTDVWEVTGNSESTLELRDVSGGDGHVDYLTFKKL